MTPHERDVRATYRALDVEDVLTAREALVRRGMTLERARQIFPLPGPVPVPHDV